MKTSTRRSPAALSSLTRSLHRASPVALPILFFLIMCFGHQSTSRPTLLVLVGLVLVFGIVRFRTLRDRIHLPLMALTVFVTMGGVSTFYAVSGKFALEEFLGIAVAFCAVVLLLLLPGEETAPARKIASVLAWAAALASLFSIDLIATKLLSGTLHVFFSLFSSAFMDLTGVEAGVRMISIFGNANIFAGCIGIGVLLSLSLVLSSETKWERRAHVCCLYINSLAFLLAFSMGASASIAVAFPVFLLLEHKDRRGDLFLLMINTLMVAAAGVAVCSMTALDRWDGIQPIPLLCLVAGSILLCLLHELVGFRLAHVLSGKGRLLVVMTVTFLVLLAGFFVAAYNVTGPVHLSQGSSLNRAAYPDPGSYTISAVGGENVQVNIRSQNKHETMMHTYTDLYKGALNEASFTVPEDSLVVYFLLSAKQDTTLEQVVYTGQAGQGSVPLGYPLLPGFIANRLQGLFANQNAIQRTVFFEDGIKIFKMRPVFGFGLGAFMSVVQSVQDFYYETRYVHNHYIQTLLETGLVGLFLFLSLLVLSAVCVLKARKRDGFHPLTPALGASLVFMSVHAGVEMAFSVYCYLPLAFGVFALIDLCCGDVLPRPGKQIRTALCLISAALLLVFSFFVTRNMTARSITEQSKSFENYDRAATIDPFEWKDYAINYMLSSTRSDASEAIRQRGDYYARRLDCGHSNIVYLRLTQYYLATGQIEQAMRMAQTHAGYIASSSSEWCNLMNLLSRYAQTDPVFLDGVAQLAKMMDAWNEAHIGHVELDGHTQAFVNWALAQ
ncbi:MAG: O-antigen ligase family protein [Oscillospiraceae bacterium]|nr:O-antigen ligase family protein [Oscillospiraceae bacterium]